MSFTFNIFISISYEKVLEAVTFIKNYLTDRNIIFQPTTGIICGTGLSIMIYIRTFSFFKLSLHFSGLSVEPLSPPLDYKEIPNYPFTAIPGHQGQLLLGRLARTQCLVFQGRAHLYQGFTAADTAFPVRLMKLLGVEQIVTTNLAGALNKDYKVTLSTHLDWSL